MLLSDGIPASDDTISYVEHIITSYRQWTGDLLLTNAVNETDLVQRILQADFALLAHGTEADPLINFANAQALRLWECSWNEFIGMPSRLTAESDQREDRARVLRDVQEHGYSNNYSGVRVSRTGRRFRICGAVVWNILGDRQQRIGQAAMFSQWSYL